MPKPLLVRDSGKPSEVAEIIGVPPTTFASAVDRKDDALEIEHTVGGTVMVSVKSAKRWAENRPRTGPKPKGQ